MNEYLLYSSLLTGCILLLIIYNKYTPKYNILYVCVCLGIITSILNHGFHSITYKYIDRFIMCLNVFVFMYFIMQLPSNQKIYTIVILILACITYLLSKLQKNIPPSEAEMNGLEQSLCESSMQKCVRNSLHSLSHVLSVVLLYLMHI
jgi:hypothetical protein